MKNNFELEKFNLMKIIAMLSVVLQHSMAIYTNWFRTPYITSNFYNLFNNYLSSYHIYIFIFASGYLYYYTTYEQNRNQDYKKFIIKKVKSLIIPYLVVSLLYIIPMRALYDNYNLSINNILNDIILAKNPSQLWFLIMLFWVFLLFKTFYNSNKRYNVFAMITVFYLLNIIGKFMSSQGYFNIFQIPNLFQSIMFFYIGFIWRKNIYFINKIIGKINIYILGMMQILLFITIYLINPSYNIIYKAIVILLKPILSLVGVILCYMLCGNILNTNIDIIKTKLYILLKKYNFSIYLLHMQIIQLILSIIYDTSIRPTILVFICFIISTTISIIISIISSRFKLGKMIFLIN